MTIPDPDDTESAPAAACTITCAAPPPYPDTHVPWFVAAPCKSRGADPGVDKEVADRDHSLGEWFGESPDYDPEDYASTVDPGSDAESLGDAEENHTVSVSPASPTYSVIIPATTSTPDPAGSGSPSCAGAGIQLCQFSRACSCSSQTTPRPTRRIVEFCCSGDSLIGSRAPPGCEVIRLTADDDLTTPGGLAKAMDAVSAPGIPVLLFGSLPCTGGSTYQYIS